jgi:hypothetical protein
MTQQAYLTSPGRESIPVTITSQPGETPVRFMVPNQYHHGELSGTLAMVPVAFGHSIWFDSSITYKQT